MTRLPARMCLCILMTMTACGSVPNKNFYTLTADAPATASTATNFRVSMGSVVLPEMVDRPQFVIQVAAHRVAILEQQRWAEPRASQISRMLAINLARQVAITNDVGTAQPVATGTIDTWRVGLDVLRFESIPGQAVRIEALWTLRRAAGELISGRSLAEEAVRSPEYESIAAAHSRALPNISRDIAGAIINTKKYRMPSQASGRRPIQSNLAKTKGHDRAFDKSESGYRRNASQRYRNVHRGCRRAR